MHEHARMRPGINICIPPHPRHMYAHVRQYIASHTSSFFVAALCRLGVCGLDGSGGRFTEPFRRKHANAHKTGKMPDGSPRNLSVPTHVPWTGGVMGRKVDLSVKWETGLDGMRSSSGESEVLWRAWESREQNLARGVKPESMPK